MHDLISRQTAIDIEGLDEEIRCEICRNPIRTNRGCDGNCTYDKKLYEKIMQMLDRRIKHVPSAQPKRGKWNRLDMDTLNCNKCGATFVLNQGSEKIDCDKMDKCEKLQLLPANNSEIPNSSDTISRAKAIDALWKALYEYEDKTEKQFQESEDLDVGDWIKHRIFVQNMNDIDRQTILNLPPAQPERIRGRWIRNDNGTYSCSVCQSWIPEQQHCYARYCLYCGADMRQREE